LGRRRVSLVFGALAFLLLVAVFGVVLNVSLVNGYSGTIYIHADGSIDPPDAPISTSDNVTYTLTDNITSPYLGITVERDNIIIDGDRYNVQGPGIYSGLGIYLVERHNITIKNMEIKAFCYGIYISDSTDNSIIANNLTNNQDSIILYSSPNNTISGNNVINSTRGISFYSSDNSICENNIANNYQGIYLSGSGNSIIGNNIMNNTSGVYFESYTSSNIMIRNDITDNMYGIFLNWFSSNHKFYHNNFINNTQQVHFEYYYYVTQVWDNGYPFGGNYWSDYNGTDTLSGLDQNQNGSDGIGDTRYSIDGYNQDQYPLINPTPPPWCPTAVFTYTPEFPAKSAIVTFNASNSYDLDGSITSYTWNFDGNITTVTDPIITHVYTALGTYAINLTVTDNDEFVHTTKNSITIWEESSTITVNVNSEDVIMGSDVTINGSITPTKPDVNVTISYRPSSGNRNTLAIVKTDLNSQYNYTWKTTAEGIYEIQTSWAGDGGLSPARSDIKTVDVYGSVFIRSDGSVEPSTAPIQHDEDLYTFTGNISVPIVVERDNIVIDGDNYTIQRDWWWYGNAIDLSNRNNVTIKATNIKGFGTGIYLPSSSHNIIYGNNVTECANYGVYLESSSSNIVSSNLIAYIGDSGVYLTSSFNNIISGNIIAHTGDTWEGIALHSSSSNIISGNTIAYNYDGVYLTSSFGNKFYHNNFVFNEVRSVCIFDDSANVWDDGYPSGGNYWSGYTGVDSDGDAIGNDIHTINVNNIDHYPLAGPFTMFNAGTWNGVSYNVDVTSNSTVSDFYFNPNPDQPSVSFNVTGENGTSGFCRVTIPKELLWVEDGWVIFVGDQQITDYSIIPDTNCTYLYFTYNHSTKTVQIIGTHAIPEFPSTTILPMLLVISMLVAVFAKKKIPRKTER
jgi:parallel beta-helix repeat protein